MIEKAHGLRETHPGTMGAGDCRCARAMKPDVREFCFLTEESSPVAPALEKFNGRQIPRHCVASNFKLADQRDESWANDRLVNISTLAVNQDRPGIKVDILQDNPRLAESATLIDGEVEGDAHPFWTCDEVFADDLFFLDRDFVNVAERFPAEAEPETGIRAGKLAADRLVHDQSQNLNVRGNRSWRDRLFLFALPPPARLPTNVNEVHDGGMIQSSRKLNATVNQERLDASPCGQITAQRLWRVGIMRFKPRADPNLPFIRVGGFLRLFLLVRSLGAQFARRARFLAVVPTVAGRFAAALAGLRVAVADLPVLRVVFSFQRRHADTSGHETTKEGKRYLSKTKQGKDLYPHGDGSWVRIPPPPSLCNSTYGHRNGHGNAGTLDHFDNNLPVPVLAENKSTPGCNATQLAATAIESSTDDKSDANDQARESTKDEVEPSEVMSSLDSRGGQFIWRAA